MSCSTEYCISNTSHPEYDDNFTSNGDYDGYPSWSGLTNGYYIYFNTTGTQWCLSSSLGGSCLLSGKSPCTSECPDLNSTYFGSGMCLTPTPTPTINCDVLSFESIFDCEFDPTPTPTPTPTQTPTITPTPTSTNVCSIINVVATITSYTPTTTPTPTITPSSSGTIDRPCHFFGDTTFNTVNDTIICPISKQFQDCFNGTMYYTTNNIINPSGGEITQYMVFNSLVDGITKCISYIGITNNISGVNNIILNSGPYGYANLGGCISCNPTPTPTPTPNVTPTKTPTPTNTLTPTNTSTNIIIPTNTPTPTKTPTPSVTQTKTPTPSVTQTKTPTPSTVPAFVGLGACDVIFPKTGSGPGLVTYKVSTNVTQTILTPTSNTSQIGRTSNRIWLEDGSSQSTTYINEYSLVENPYSTSLLRTISISNLSTNNIFRGYNSINSTTLLSYASSFPSSLYTLDITTTTAVETLVWSIPSSRTITANLLYTTNDRVIYLNYDNSNNFYITQKVYSTGVQEFDTFLGPAPNSYSALFQEGNSIYIVMNSPSKGNVYRVNPTYATVLTLVGTINYGLSSAGQAGQPSTCITIPIDPASWGGEE
jgi:hypothetical protein